MEIFAAILRFNSHGRGDDSSRRFHPPQDFELLLTSDHRGHGLPRFRTRNVEPSAECALRSVRKLSSALAKRAIPVPLCTDKPSSSAQEDIHSKLVCLPVVLDMRSKTLERISGEHRFCNLSHLVNLAIKADSWLDKESQYLIICLDEWLTKCQHKDVEFLASLFRCRPAAERIRACAHNPGQSPRLVGLCYSIIGRPNAGEARRKSSELEEAIQKSNNTRAYMISKEKYKLCLINPVFGGVITRSMKEAAPDYYAKGRRTRQRLRSECQPNAWEQMFPLHAAAYAGDTQTVKRLLDHGYDPNQADMDTWTPLHYCTFYNRFEACEALMLHSGTHVNATNKTGSTPLHFACLNGHELLVELMLSHSGLEINIRDNNGRTPLELCEQVSKPEWVRAAYLLRNKQLRPEKIEIQLLGRACLQLKCDLTTATAEQIRDKVLRLEGITNPSASRIFAIWLESERLGLQLKADKQVQVHLDRWPEHLDKWADPPSANHRPEDDRPRILLKRDARTLLGDERKLASCAAVVRLLYAEAEHNFLDGMYPCKEKDTIRMAAIILRLLYGDKQKTVDHSILATIMPKHLIAALSEREYKRLCNRILEAHAAIPRTNVPQLQFDFLQHCWSQKFYGCTFFKAHMYRSKPPYETTNVFVGINDWGISVIHQQTRKSLESLDINVSEMHYEQGRNYVEVCRRKHETLIFNTPQAVLINNLFTQLKAKVSSAAHHHSGSNQAASKK